MNAEHAKSDARSGPLAGIRVLDLGVMVSSPFATRAMADLGAEIIKVEAFEGDPQRAGGGLKPGGNPTAIFASVQRNRLGVAVDLKKPEGARVVLDLARRSDVVVANFRPGVAARLGVDYKSLSAENPNLIYCSITGFGEDGPLSNVPVTDGVIQAFAGVLELTGTGGTFGHPFKVVIADQIAGATACQAILGALVGRQVDGRGRKIDISMLDCMLSWLHTATRFDVAGPSSTTFLLEASDGRHVLVQCPLHFEERFIGLIVGQPGFEHLASDERFTSRKKRAENRQQYVEAVQGAFKSMTAAQWLEKLATAFISYRKQVSKVWC